MQNLKNDLLTLHPKFTQNQTTTYAKLNYNLYKIKLQFIQN